MTPGENKFSYGHLLFYMRMGYISVFFISALLILVPGSSIAYMAAFICLYMVCLVVFGITPLMTRHEVGYGGMILRQGILFKIEIPWEAIEGVEKLDALSMGYGVTASIMKPRISLATIRNNLVLIRLKRARRFISVLWKQADEIIIDVNMPDTFIERAEEHLIQANQFVD